MTNFQRQAGRYFHSSGSPATIAIIAINALTFLIFAFGGQFLAHAMVLVTAGGLSRPWTFLTWPLFSPEPVGLLFGAIWAIWCLGSLERSWGTTSLVVFYLAVNTIAAISMFVGSSILGVSGSLLGIMAGVAAPTVAWATINKREVVMMMGVAPIPAPWLAIITMVFLWYWAGPSQGSPVLGFFPLAGCAAAYWYANRGRFVVRGWTGRRTRTSGKGKLRMTTLENVEGLQPKSPLAKLKARQEQRKLEDLWRRSTSDDHDDGPTRR